MIGSLPMKKDIYCFGAVVVDLIGHPVKQLPAPGDSARAPAIEVAIGGCAANTATALARLEHRVHLCGAVGDDLLGGFLRQGLEREGVDIEHLSIEPEAPTGSTFVINVEDEDRRFISATGANDEPWPAAICATHLEDAAVVSFHAYGLSRSPDVQDTVRIFQLAREVGATTLLDVIVIPGEDLTADLQQILPLVDGFFPNDDESYRLTGRSNPADAAAALRDLGAETVVVTCGERGLVWDAPCGRGSLGILEEHSVDATGCGDAFVAGYIDGEIDGLPLSEKLIRGSVMGAAAVSAAGAISGLPRRQQFQKKLDRWIDTASCG